MSSADPSPYREPAIVSPMSRYLSIADLDRSAKFYRDVLGFDVGPVTAGNSGSALAEAVRGPARVQFVTQESAFDGTGRPRPRGSAILFFETDNVAGLREAVSARGGKPSELAKVNWIKMRMFEIRDPDGHTLWFGESFDEPDQPASRSLLQQIMPELPLDDVPAGVAHFRDVLGFHVNYAQDDIGVMDRDGVRVLLIARTDRHKGIGSCYVCVSDADKLYAELRGKGANVGDEPVSHPWGLRDFRVLDPEGNQIRFGQPFE
jgi:catechol 2,3-dioxygenase-like lactoylglutathione lyase family enzyme